MRTLRYWSVEHSGILEKVYLAVEWLMVRCHPIFNLIGYERLEKPFIFIEKISKGLLFDCQMCGQCALSATGMSCPMNCPKTLRNGPCGGVRANGHCEVKPEMRCVWVEAAKGSRKMKTGYKINIVQLPVDNSLKGKSTWIPVIKEKTAKNILTKNSQQISQQMQAGNSNDA